MMVRRVCPKMAVSIHPLAPSVLSVRNVSAVTIHMIWRVVGQHQSEGEGGEEQEKEEFL